MMGLRPFQFILFVLWTIAIRKSFATDVNGSMRTYFVGAVEEDWDYMPT